MQVQPKRNGMLIRCGGATVLLATLCCAFHGGNGGGAEPSFVGFVTAITQGGGPGLLAKVTVESHADKLLTRFVVRITSETEIARQDAGGERPVAIDALREKDWVKIWFVLGTPSSAPREVVARRLLIVPRP